jgi:protein TonB
MEIKKSPHVDAERSRISFFFLGLFFSAAFVFMAFTFGYVSDSGSSGNDNLSKRDEAFDVVDVDEPPPPEETPPPPDAPEVPPPPTDEVKEVEKEEEQTKVSIAPPDVAPPPVTTAPPPPPPAEEIFDVVEEEPSFPGGEEAMQKFIKANIKYPEMSIQMGDQGKVFVRFVVEKDGSISNVTIARGVTPELDKEAMRVVKSMPNWSPGKQRGRPVRTNVVIPIVFKLG